MIRIKLGEINPTGKNAQVKKFRSATGCGLKECKFAIDVIELQGYFNTQRNSLSKSNSVLNLRDEGFEVIELLPEELFEI